MSIQQGPPSNGYGTSDGHSTSEVKWNEVKLWLCVVYHFNTS